MIKRRRYDLVLAIYLESRGFAFALFDGWCDPADWGFFEARGANNERSVRRVEALLELRAPDVVVLQDTSEGGTRRARRIRALNLEIAHVAQERGIFVRTYSRGQIAKHFDLFGAGNKQQIAETIAKHIPALDFYVPPPRKP